WTEVITVMKFPAATHVLAVPGTCDDDESVRVALPPAEDDEPDVEWVTFIKTKMPRSHDRYRRSVDDDAVAVRFDADAVRLSHRLLLTHCPKELLADFVTGAGDAAKVAAEIGTPGSKDDTTPPHRSATRDEETTAKLRRMLASRQAQGSRPPSPSTRRLDRVEGLLDKFVVGSTARFDRIEELLTQTVAVGAASRATAAAADQSAAGAGGLLGGAAAMTGSGLFGDCVDSGADGDDAAEAARLLGIVRGASSGADVSGNGKGLRQLLRAVGQRTLDDEEDDELKATTVIAKGIEAVAAEREIFSRKPRKAWDFVQTQFLELTGEVSRQDRSLVFFKECTEIAKHRVLTQMVLLMTRIEKAALQGNVDMVLGLTALGYMFVDQALLDGGRTDIAEKLLLAPINIIKFQGGGLQASSSGLSRLIQYRMQAAIVAEQRDQNTVTKYREGVLKPSPKAKA
ncbi:MAG: hypothetical protein VX246_08940, partial [Myxococcota bacterium]|nr:hypothetical protein [Myxococcota bacterium]